MAPRANLPKIATERLRNAPVNLRGLFEMLGETKFRKALKLSGYRYLSFLEYCFPRISSPNPLTLAEAGLYLSNEGVVCQFCFATPIPIGDFFQMVRNMSVAELKELHLKSSPYCPIKHKNIFNTPLDDNVTDKRFEMNRLFSLLDATYKNPQLWKDVNPLERCLDMATNGFYYENGPSDQVRCFYCRITFENWDAGDSAATEHVSGNPECQFITHRHTTGNVELGQEEISGVGADVTAFAYPDDTTTRSFPNYENWQLRVDSFANWKHGQSANLKAEKMANAGFFYTGKDDLVACFHCGIGLEGWNPEIDQPEEVHNRLRIGCTRNRPAPVS